MLRGNGFEVLGFIDAVYAHTGCIHVDLVDAAGFLSEPPIRRKRKFQKLKQQGAIDAVMTDQHGGFVGMAREHHAQRIGRPRRQILQRFAVRESHQLRGGEPCREQRCVLCLGFGESLELPGAVIDIVEIVAVFAATPVARAIAAAVATQRPIGLV